MFNSKTLPWYIQEIKKDKKEQCKVFKLSKWWCVMDSAGDQLKWLLVSIDLIYNATDPAATLLTHDQQEDKEGGSVTSRKYSETHRVNRWLYLWVLEVQTLVSAIAQSLRLGLHRNNQACCFRATVHLVLLLKVSCCQNYVPEAAVNDTWHTDPRRRKECCIIQSHTDQDIAAALEDVVCQKYAII